MVNATHVTEKVRFESEEEIKDRYTEVNFESGDVMGAGVPIISTGRTAYVDDSEASTFVVGASGSGKTRKILMPYTLSCIRKNENLVIHDPKGEINRYMYRELEKKGYEVIVLDYRRPLRGDRYNPLEYPSKIYKEGNTSRAAEMFQAFSETMFSDRKSEKDRFWDLTAASYMTGLSLLQAELLPEKECTINHLYDLHIQGDGKYGRSKYIKEYYNRPGAKDAPSYKLAAPAINAPSDTQGGLYSVYTSCLTPFVLNEDIIDATANSTFDVRDLVEKKCAVFIITKDEGSVYNKLISATIDQMYERLIDIAEEEYDGRLPRRINFILDEFGNLAAINNMSGKITAGRSRNIRWLIVCQSMDQLRLLYENKGASIIFGNCANLVYLYSTDIMLLQRISAMCGLYSDELTGAKHPLMSMDHLRYLNKDKGEVLLLLERARPFVGYLPDISAYPVSPTQHVNVCERERQTLNPIDFQEIVNKQKRELMEKKMAEENGKSKSDEVLPFGCEPGEMELSVVDLNKDEMNGREKKGTPIIPPEDIDRMIAEIDRKIAQLEEEERLENDQKMKRLNFNGVMQDEKGNRFIRFRDGHIETPKTVEEMEKAIDRRIAEIELDKRIEKKREQIHKKSNSKGKNANSRKNKHELKDDDSGDSEKS
ncbi:type IV secretory system conjugative DNA transfer family protein [Coprococcus eutactus]|jgi:type IV secretion system protein VirD4|uniref:type IV secretory system conjugative DNA transfer family protein n=1 Tax=Coprococcus eutactus TaxID=33043 RepID=UPI00015EAD63|nr:type IV secretory system conjugative DNA transfer family protein [Coprococcus eutactus]EDP25261.1 putative phage head-tail adaptor [Coprococcus eutactus ATCC 27759]UEA79633.1 type IV secretory system conjugative DNA transfer family protein [Coprococcus eutactus ATCC 27759]UWP15981.1 type IV secretory system conjugative DNA transfer family protein [Coprococcus eutactus]